MKFFNIAQKNNRKQNVLTGISLCLMLLPQNAYTSEKKSENYKYVTAQYYADFFTNISDLTGNENTLVHKIDIHGFNKNGEAQIYAPEYITDYMAGGLSIGYAMKGLKFEFEGQYANVLVNDSHFPDKEMSKYVEITREDLIKGNVDESNPLYKLNKDAFSITCGRANSGILPDPASKPGSQITLFGNDHLATKFSNEGIRFIAGFANIVFEPITSENYNFVPFISAGLGIAQTKFLGVCEYGLAYQTKIGANYHINKNIGIFLAYDYRTSFAKEYKNVKPVIPILAVIASSTSTDAPKEAVIASDSAIIHTTFAVHGLTAGILIKF